MDHSKPEPQQQEQVSSQPETTPDTLEGQKGGPQESQEYQQEVTKPKVMSRGEGQLGPVESPYAPPMASKPSLQMGASALVPGQRRIQPHVVVRPQTDETGKLQLSPKDWPMPGEFYPRNRLQNPQELKSPPQLQQLSSKSPGAVQGNDSKCTVQCPQADTDQQPEQHIEVNTNSSTQEIIHDGEAAGEIIYNGEGIRAPEVIHAVKLENEDTQKAESTEANCEKEYTTSVACCTQSNASAEPVNLCPKPSTSDQAIEDTASSGESTPTLTPEDCTSDQGSSSESVRTVLAAGSELPQIDLAAGPPQTDLAAGLPQIDLAPAGIYMPEKTVFAPNHWGTHTYPTSFSYDPSSYENFIGRVPNFPLPYNFPPSSTFVPMIAKKGLVLRHELPCSNNYPGVFGIELPYYVAQQPQINYYPVPPNQQWQTAQRLEPIMQPQQVISHEGLSELQRQNMMHGQQRVLPHQEPDTDHFPVQQIHPTAHMVHYPPIIQQQHYSSVGHQNQMSQRGVLLNQIPSSEPLAVSQERTPVSQQSHMVVLPQGPPVTQQSNIIRFEPPGTNVNKVENVMQAMTPQQFPPVTSLAQLPLQFPPVTHEQLQQLRSQVPVSYTITNTTPQPNAIQSQQGLMQHRPPILQHLPVPQHHLPEADQHNQGDLLVHPSNIVVPEQKNVFPTTKMSPETEDKQAGGEEAQGLKRPACPRTPWVEEVEAEMIRKQATIRSADPVLSATPPTIPFLPDFSRPPPPIEHLATALGINIPPKPQYHAMEPSKPPQHHRANGAQWPEQYQVPPRMLNNHNGNKQWTNPPPLGIPSRRGRGGCYTTNIGQPGHGARFPGRSESVQQFNSMHLHMNGHGPSPVPLPHISRNDTVPTTSNNYIPAEEDWDNNSDDPQKEHCNSEVACQEELDTNRDRHEMDQPNSGGRNNHGGNSIPFHHGHRQHRGAHSGNNNCNQQRAITPTETNDNTKTNQPSTTSNHDT